MVLIVGAGLSGLLTGYLLKKEGIPFKILEARDRVGGRINTLYGPTKAPVEMGATWFTNQHKHFIALLAELAIPYFEQSTDSFVFYEAALDSPAQLVQIPSQAPSFRISGGTSRLLSALLQSLDETDVLLNQSVKQIKLHKDAVQVNTELTFNGHVVVLALPPKLWAKRIVFDPPLPTDLMRVARQTHTWMEDSIKIGLTYDNPFWGQANLPGTLFSNVGPINELYDHSNHEKSKYALCGFIDSSLKTKPYAARRESVINQMVSVFGVKAKEFTSYEECLWGEEENTFEASEVFLGPHENNGNPIFNTPIFDGKVLISSTESASEFPGYMEGAVRTAQLIAEKLKRAQHDW
jgi:monoamine oxidase